MNSLGKVGTRWCGDALVRVPAGAVMRTYRGVTACFYPEDMVTDVDAWLLDNDPALRWQVERHLGEQPEVWTATRARVATEGFGARLLALQDADGQWAGGAFFPKDFEGDGPQPWTATTWSLNALRGWGLDAAVLGDTASRIAQNSRWEYDDLPYWDGEVDVCINSYTLANGAWLGVDMTALAQWFVDHQLDDGGWNCEWVDGSVRSSFHSTLNALRGILQYEQATGGTPPLREARLRGQEYLLSRRLLYTATNGELVGDWVNQFAYPQRWKYSALNALDYFRQAALHDGTKPDPRLADAIEMVQAARQPDGTWLQHHRDPGLVWFDVDVPEGEPSPWLTFSARQVLEWWDENTG